MSVLSIALADDHPILLEGLAAMLNKREAIRLAGKGSCADEAVAIVSLHEPDVIIMDINMPGDVFTAITRISDPGRTKVIVFTASTSIDQAVRALDSGAAGYVLKGGTIDELMVAIESVRDGSTYITQGFAVKVIAALQAQYRAKLRPAAADRLTVREDQIMRLLMHGKKNREIAAALSLSEKTVKSYMTSLMQKLNARSRVEVVLAARQAEDGAVRAGRLDLMSMV